MNGVTRQSIGGAAIHWKPPFKDQLMCMVVACVIHTTENARAVTCPECLRLMGDNYLRNMEAAGLVPAEDAKHLAHEAECRSAAEALLRERARKRVKPADWCPHGRPPHEDCDDCAESDAEECAL